jgi:serine/threonine protein kinase
VAGLLHLHALGILHRDLRAANLLIDSDSESFDSRLHVLVADLGLSHLLSAFAAGRRVAGLTASRVPTGLTGTAGRGPLQVRGRYVCKSPISALSIPMHVSRAAHRGVEGSWFC